jgi:hypothetical protein
MATADAAIRGPETWFEKLDRSQQEELLALRAQFNAGKLPYTRNALATAIANELGSIKTAAVVAWLKKETQN